MVSNKNIKAIFFSIGGKSAIQMLEYIDWNFVKNNPKIYLGISDSSTIMLPIFQKTGIVTFCGSEVIKVWGIGISNYEINNLKTLLFEERITNDTFIPNLNREAVWGDFDTITFKKEKWEVFKEGRSKGTLIGGTFNTINILFGSEYFQKVDNPILFFDSFSDNSEDLHQKLTSLKYRGLFENVKGLIVGLQANHLKLKGDPREKELTKIINLVFEKYDFPIVYIPDYGHIVRSLVLPIGAEVEIDTKKDNFITFY